MYITIEMVYFVNIKVLNNTLVLSSENSLVTPLNSSINFVEVNKVVKQALERVLPKRYEILSLLFQNCYCCNVIVAFVAVASARGSAVPLLLEYTNATQITKSDMSSQARRIGGDWVENIDKKSGKSITQISRQKRRRGRTAELAGKGGGGDDWLERKDPKSGKTYYYNPKTSQTSWTKPTADTTTLAASSDPSDWKARTDPTTGKTYYYNSKTRQSSWQKPEGYTDVTEAGKADEPAKGGRGSRLPLRPHLHHRNQPQHPLPHQGIRQ